MKPFKAVFFDLGYTLVKTDREVRLQQCLSQIGAQLSLPALERAYHWADKLFMREYPGLLAKDPSQFQSHYMQTLLSHLGLDTPPEELRQPGAEADRDFRGYWMPIPGAIEVLQALRNRGLIVGLVSNWDHTASQVLSECGLDSLLDITVISSELAIEKPNPEIFAHALKQAGILPEDALYVGDNFYDDVVGARNAGMEAVLLNRFDFLGIEEIKGCQVYPSVVDVFQALDERFCHPAYRQGTAG